MVNCGELISESDLIRYVQNKCQERRERLLRCNPENKDQKPFTVIWFDETKKESAMCFTNAIDSAEALYKTSSHYPLLSNVSAYPLHLPKTLKFKPDEYWVA